MTPNETLDNYFAMLEQMKNLRGDPRARLAWEIVSQSKAVADAHRIVYPDEALPINPAYERLAVEYEHLGRYDDAIQICRKAQAEGWRDVEFDHRIARCESQRDAAKPARGYTDPGRTGVACQHCGREMHQSTRGESNIGLQVLGILVFLFGLVLLFLFPIGTLFGIFLMIGAARMGYTKKKIWLCKACGYFFERAN